MRTSRHLALMGWCIACSFWVTAQRSYAPSSVLATGNWYKLDVKAPGIYKIDIATLTSLGINTSNLSSGSIRLFGNGGQMMAEANADPWTDDLKENAIQIMDGGDGIINGTDYLLFYANGPDEWVKDSANLRFLHRKNVFSDRAYYFLNIGGSNGKRISNAPLVTSPGVTVTSFSERYFHELDTVNFLAGSKEWYGEELSALPGRSLTKNFAVSFPNITSNAPVVVQTNAVARSVGTGSRFDVRVNNQPAGQITINSVGGGLYDLFGQQGNGSAIATASQTTIDVSYTYVP